MDGLRFKSSAAGRLTCAALALGASLLAMAGSATASPVLPIDHAGRWMIDARGRVVILHGTNMVNKRAPSIRLRSDSVKTTRLSFRAAE